MFHAVSPEGIVWTGDTGAFIWRSETGVKLGARFGWWYLAALFAKADYSIFQAPEPIGALVRIDESLFDSRHVWAILKNSDPAPAIGAIRGDTGKTECVVFKDARGPFAILVRASRKVPIRMAAKPSIIWPERKLLLNKKDFAALESEEA